MTGKILALRRAYAHNLLDNSDFVRPINQRGQAQYAGSEKGAYSIDRWKIFDGVTVDVSASGVAVTGGVINQYLEGVYSGVHTLAAMRADGSVILHSGDITAAYVYTAIEPALGKSGDLYRISLPAGTYKWAALYEGAYTADTLPPYMHKGYAADLAECQRYYYALTTPTILNGLVTSASKRISLDFMHPLNIMRAIPEIEYDGVAIIRTVAGYSTAEGFTTLNGGNVNLLESFYVSVMRTITMTFKDNASSVNNSTVSVEFTSRLAFSADL